MTIGDHEIGIYNNEEDERIVGFVDINDVTCQIIVGNDAGDIRALVNGLAPNDSLNNEILEFSGKVIKTAREFIYNLDDVYAFTFVGIKNGKIIKAAASKDGTDRITLLNEE